MPQQPYRYARKHTAQQQQQSNSSMHVPALCLPKGCVGIIMASPGRCMPELVVPGAVAPTALVSSCLLLQILQP